MRWPAKSTVTRKWSAAIGALALVGAVLTPALAAPQSASAWVTIIAPSSTAYDTFTVRAIPDTAGGKVIFYYYKDGYTLMGTRDVIGGTATITVSLPSSLIGSTIQLVTEYYYSDGSFAYTSGGPFVYVYKQLGFGGTVYVNGLPYDDARVDLVPVSGPSSSAKHVTTVGGSFAGTANGGSDASNSYQLSATVGSTTSYYSGASCGTNASSANAATLTTLTFANDLNICLNTAATFSEATIVMPHKGANYVDGVSASSNVGITYSVYSGALPTGLGLDPTTGVISGVATNVGETYDFVVLADNGILPAYTGHITGTVLSPFSVPDYEDDELADFRVGEPYFDGLSAWGVDSPTFRLLSGSLPRGVTLDPAGAVEGTPTVAGPYSFTIVAENSVGVDSRTFSGTVAPAWVRPYWDDNALEFDPRVGVAFADGVEALGDGTIVYDLKTGVLPAWLSFDTATGALTGTPTDSDLGIDFTFELRATSEHGSTSVWITGEVESAPEVGLDPDFKVGDTAAGATGSYEINGAGDGTVYDVTVHSTPAKIVAGTISTAGPTIGTFTIPSGLGEGAHSLVLTAHAADGTPRTFTLWFTIKSDGTIGAISYDGPITYLELVTSGTEPLIPGALAFGLLALGGILLVRRRRELQQA
jgi:MYXO-CTERM domain-containing protein